MIATHNIKDISFGQNTITLLIDGKSIELSLDKVSKKLKDASELQRKFFKISPSGYGIHWPLIDEDLSVDAILKLARPE
jgi:translation elongation factor EF-1beta